MAKSQQAGGSEAGAFRIVYGVVKTLAILVGGAVTLPALMALVGLATDNGWIRLGVAVVVAVGLPLFVADRLLPDDDPTKGKGLPTDVFALGWLGFALLYVGIAGPWTGAWLWQESDRLEDAGMGALASGVRWIAGPAPAPEDQPGEDANASGEGVDNGGGAAKDEGSTEEGRGSAGGSAEKDDATTTDAAEAA